MILNSVWFLIIYTKIIIKVKALVFVLISSFLRLFTETENNKFYFEPDVLCEVRSKKRERIKNLKIRMKSKGKKTQDFV